MRDADGGCECAMMRRSIRARRLFDLQIQAFCFLTLIIFSSASAPASADGGPSPSDLHAYSIGQSYVRSFQDYLEPGTCGIVLERPRCLADFASVQEFVGARKMDVEVAKWLQDGDLQNRVLDWEGVEIPDATWQKDPAFGWWYTAGALSIAVDMPKNDATSKFVTSIVDVLAAHDDAAPTQFKGMVGNGDSPVARTKSLVDGLNAAVPQTEFPAVLLATGETGDAQLGVFSSTLTELVDNPMALSRPETRAFALAVVDQLERLDRKVGGSFSFDGLRNSLRGDIPMDSASLDLEFRQPLSAWPPKMNPPSRELIALYFGTATAQAAYNAAILKDKNADESYLRGFISQTPPYAGMSTEAMAAVAKMQNDPYGDWSKVNGDASAATLAIIGR